MAISLESGLDATVADFDVMFDTELSSDAKKFWLNVGYDFLQTHVDFSAYTTNEKSRMELVAAADAASTQDPRVYQEAVGDAEFRYQRMRDQTDYWQWLQALDKNNELPPKKSAPSASFKSFGPGRD